MTTRGTMKDEIIEDLERDSTNDSAAVLRAISAAIKFYQTKRFFFNESRSVTFSTVADQWQYDFGTGEDITTEFYKIDLALVEDTGNDYILFRRDYREIELLNDNTATTNRPDTYGYINKSLVFYPIPDAAYTVRLTGHVKVAEPAADGTADNLWFTEAYELIKCRAKSLLCAHSFPNAEVAALMRVAEADARSALQSATMDKAGAGFIIPSDF